MRSCEPQIEAAEAERDVWKKATEEAMRVHGEWEVKRLGDHVAFLRNGTNSRAELTQEDPVKYLHYGDVHACAGTQLRPNALPSLPSEKAKSLARLQDGDLVFADASEDLAGVGKSVEMRGVAGTETVPGLHTIAARFDKSVLADGFKSYLQFCPTFSGQLRRLAAGTKVYATNRAHIASIEMPLPGVEEQTAIAAALSDVDALLGGLDRLIAKKRDLKQAAMHQLLTGQTRLPGFSGKWNVKPLGDLGHWRGGSTPLMSKRNYWVGGTVPWLSSSDVRQGWIKNVSGHITEEAIAETSVPLIPPDSVIVVIRSGILRRFLPVARCSRTVAINQDLRALHPGPHHDPAFLVHALVGFERRLLLDCLKTGTHMPRADWGVMRNFEVRLPRVREQLAIAEILSDMDGELAALEARLDKTRDLKQGMMQELLTGRTRLI